MLRLISSCLVVAFGTNFQIYSASVVNNVEQIIQSWLDTSYSSRRHNGHHLDRFELNIFWSATVACVHGGAVLGSLLIGYVAEKIGRKNGLLLNSVLLMIGSLLSGYCKLANSFEMLLIGRFLIGVGVGLGYGLSAMYLTEVPPYKLRGAMGSMQQLFLGFGDFISVTISLPQFLGTQTLWPFALALPLFPALLQLIVLYFCPETPRFLYITKNRPTQSMEAIEFYQSSQNVIDVLSELELEKKQLQSIDRIGMWRLLTDRVYRRPLLLAVAVAVGSQFTGIGPVMTYSTGIFQDAGLSKSTAQYGTCVLGFLNFVVPLLVICVIERVGRRVLLFTGYIGCILALSALMIFARLQQLQIIRWAAHASIASLVFFQIFFAISAPIGWFVAAELFGQSARSAAVSVVNVLQWLCATLFVLFYLPFEKSVGVQHSFIPFVCILGLCTLFLWFKLPETKGRTIENILYQIQQHQQRDDNYSETSPLLIQQRNGR